MDVRRLALRAAVTLLMGAGLALGLLCLLDGQPARVVAGFAPHRAERPEREAVRAPGSAITVCLDGGCDFDTVQAAVDAADAGDEIRVATGVYSGVSARAGVTQVVYISKSVTVRGGYTTTDWSAPHPLSAPTTLDAEGQGRVLYIAAGVSPTVEGLRITGGSAGGLGGGPSGWQDVGGGVYVHGGAATISGCQVVSNTALWGGGLYLRRGRATLMNNEIAYNVALPSDSTDSRGGAIYLREDESILRANTIRANRADWGGGLYLYLSRALISDSDVIANVAVRFDGGGLCANFGAPRLRANTFAGNTAGSGGGVWIWQADPLMFIENMLVYNVADWGGGLSAIEDRGVISGNTVMGNQAENGGGILVDNGSPGLMNNRVVSNVATRKGGGLYLYRTDVVVTNTLIADNAASERGSGLLALFGEARLLHTTVARNGWNGSVTVSAGERAARPLAVAHATQPKVDDGDGTGLTVDGATVGLTNTILAGHKLGISVESGEPGGVARLQSTLWGSGAWANGIDWSGPGISHTDDYWGDPAFVDPDAGDYHIYLSSAAVDQGVDAGVDRDIDGDPRPVPVGGGFDLGADEYTEIDLSASRKGVHPDQAGAGDVLTYTIVLLNEGNVRSRDSLLVDALPTQTTYISGSAETSGGVLTDSDSIVWSGTLTPYQPVTITFSVTLGEPSLVVQNTAVVTDERGGVATLWALVNGWRSYLPLILR